MRLDTIDRRQEDQIAYLSRIEPIVADIASRQRLDSNMDLTTSSSTEHVTRM